MFWQSLETETRLHDELNSVEGNEERRYESIRDDCTQVILKIFFNLCLLWFISSLSHPNIIQLKGIRIDKPPFGLLMEHAYHGDLLSVSCGETSIDINEYRILYAKEICEGMKYLYSRKHVI